MKQKLSEIMNSFEKWLDDNLMVEDYISPILNKPMHTLWTLDKVKEQYLASKESERLKYCGKCLSMANQLSLDEVKKLLKDNELCICGHKYKEHEEDDEADYDHSLSYQELKALFLEKYPLPEDYKWIKNETERLEEVNHEQIKEAVENGLGIERKNPFVEEEVNDYGPIEVYKYDR